MSVVAGAGAAIVGRRQTIRELKFAGLTIDELARRLRRDGVDAELARLAGAFCACDIFVPLVN